MSMTAKTVVGKFEAATPCGGKKGYLVKIQKMMSSPEKKHYRNPGKSTTIF